MKKERAIKLYFSYVAFPYTLTHTISCSVKRRHDASNLNTPRAVTVPKLLTILSFHFYRPHPKDGEGTVFTGVCLFTGWYPSSRFFPRSLIPGPGWGDTPVLAKGYHTGQDWVTSPRQNSRLSTRYAAGGMPLTVTLEDFLVLLIINNYQIDSFKFQFSTLI